MKGLSLSPPAVVVEVAHPDFVRHVDAVRAHLGRSVEEIIAVGCALLDAKAELDHGLFGPLLDDVGLSRSAAGRYMRVADSPIAKCARVHNLPAAVGTLEVLAQIPVDVLNQYIDNGEISASTTRKDALRLVNHATDPYAARVERWSGYVAQVDGWFSDLGLDPSELSEWRSGGAARHAAQVWWRSGEWLPTPPFWPSDGAEYIARVAGELRGFLDWMANVGIEPASFLERFLDDDVTKAELFSTLDAEALAEWWLDGSDNDRRFAALGHWFSWCSSIARSS